MREREDSDDLSVDGRIILNWIFKKWDGRTNWIDLAYDRDSWRALVSALVNLRVTMNARNFLSS